MDLDKTGENLDKIDGILFALKNIIKKHWGFLIFILIVLFFYYALTEDYVVYDNIEQDTIEEYEQYDQYNNEEPYIEKYEEEPYMIQYD
jgi:hypothetical protein